MTTTLSVQIDGDPSDELLEEVRLFLHEEADWDQTVFELTITKGILAIVRDTDNRLLGTSNVHALSPHNLWLGNVCVAKRARRSGIGSAIVSTLLERASEERVRSHVVLIASKLGESVYRRLGFKDVPNITISYYKRPALPAPSHSRLRPRVPSEKEHEEAIRLEEQVGGAYRGELLNALFKKDRLCVVLKSGGSLMAAAWARYMDCQLSTNLPSLHIGPVVAKTSAFAESVISEVLRIHQAASTLGQNRCMESTALVVRVGENHAAEGCFESLGFEKLCGAPYLQKGLTAEADPSPSFVDIATANEQYFATTWWDIA